MLLLNYRAPLGAFGFSTTYSKCTECKKLQSTQDYETLNRQWLLMSLQFAKKLLSECRQNTYPSMLVNIIKFNVKITLTKLKIATVNNL